MLQKNPINIGFYRMWHASMNSSLFFKYMPYIKENFRLVDTPHPKVVFSLGAFPVGALTKVYYNYENLRPDTKNSNWSFGADYEEDVNHPRYFRQPNYVRLGAGENLIKKEVNVQSILCEKTKFCNFLYCHDIPLRNEFFKMLSKYKKIDSPGNCCANMPALGGFATGWQSRFGPCLYEQKLEFLKPYKFTIAFENSSYPGYTSEKIYHPMLVNSIPIYWGNPCIERDFNTKSFISAHTMKYTSYQHMLSNLVDCVIAIDQNDALYTKMLEEPWYPNNQMTKWTNKNYIVSQFQKVFGESV